MYRIVKALSFCYGHRLLGHPGKCGRPHGHNAVVEVELSSGALDRRGMLRDFAEVKGVLEDVVVGKLDHRMLLREDDPLVGALRSVGEEPVALDVDPTAENLARRIFLEARAVGLPVTRVCLWETPTSRAEYGEEPAGPSRGAGAQEGESAGPLSAGPPSCSSPPPDLP